MTAQWVKLGDGEMLVATREGAWIQPHQAATFALWGSMPPSTPATPDETRHLLNGAIAAGERASDGRDPALPNARTWALSLVDQWYTAHHGVSLLPVAIERYDSMRRPDLARFARRKLEEEAGHDRMALADLRALGYDADLVVEKVPPGKTARALIESAREWVHGPCPVRFFGYIFTVEWRAARITDKVMSALDSVLPAGVEAASCIRAHASEFDPEHVEELLQFIAELPADDRTEVAFACCKVATICRGLPPADNPEIDREERISRLQQTSPTNTTKEQASER